VCLRSKDTAALFLTMTPTLNVDGVSQPIPPIQGWDPVSVHSSDVVRHRLALGRWVLPSRDLTLCDACCLPPRANRVAARLVDIIVVFGDDGRQQCGLRSGNECAQISLIVKIGFQLIILTVSLLRFACQDRHGRWSTWCWGSHAQFDRGGVTNVHLSGLAIGQNAKGPTDY
jgi:hypothetical protein